MISYLIGLILVGIPTLIVIKSTIKDKVKKRKELELAMAYDRLMRSAKLSIENIDLLNGKLIGLDRMNKKMVFIDHTKTKRQEHCIALLEIASCYIHKVKGDPEKEISSIHLELKHKRNDEVTRFCFYDDSCDRITDLPSLARKAKFWKNRIDLNTFSDSSGRSFEYAN
ncbi:MAG: hypothetical protein ABIN57_01865 [Chitinophagaceae bacterium]